MNSIKTFAIATFPSEYGVQEAIKNIHSLIWPPSTGKSLSVMISENDHAGDMTGGAGERLQQISTSTGIYILLY